MQATRPIPHSQIGTSATAMPTPNRAYKRARRHSRLVRILRKAMPATAVLCVIGFAGLIAMSYNPFSAIALAGLELNDGKLVMKEPKLEGFDNDNQPYTVTAARASHDLNNTNEIDLDAVSAEIGSKKAERVNVEAGKGRYDRGLETLTLSNGVEIVTKDGLNITMQQADIDLNAGALKSDQPVRVLSDDTEITADRLQVLDEGKRIVFSNRVRMTIKRPISGDAASE